MLIAVVDENIISLFTLQFPFDKIRLKYFKYHFLQPKKQFSCTVDEGLAQNVLFVWRLCVLHFTYYMHCDVLNSKIER